MLSQARTAEARSRPAWSRHGGRNPNWCTWRTSCDRASAVSGTWSLSRKQWSSLNRPPGRRVYYVLRHGLHSCVFQRHRGCLVRRLHRCLPIAVHLLRLRWLSSGRRYRRYMLSQATAADDVCTAGRTSCGKSTNRRQRELFFDFGIRLCDAHSAGVGTRMSCRKRHNLHRPCRQCLHHILRRRLQSHRL